MGRPMLACPDRRSPKPGCHCAHCVPRAAVKYQAYLARRVAAGLTRYPRWDRHPVAASTEQVERWRCPCDPWQVRSGSRCPACGSPPPWVEA
jgi:hypothetical protein